jgi:hypothetical protein
VPWIYDTRGETGNYLGPPRRSPFYALRDCSKEALPPATCSVGGEFATAQQEQARKRVTRGTWWAKSNENNAATFPRCVKARCTSPDDRSTSADEALRESTCGMVRMHWGGVESKAHGGLAFQIATFASRDWAPSNCPLLQVSRYDWSALLELKMPFSVRATQ